MDRFVALLALLPLFLGIAPAARALDDIAGPPVITDPDLGIDETPPLEGATRFYEKDYADTWIDMVVQSGTATSELYRARGPQGPWTLIRTLPTSATTTVRDSGLTPGGFYCYKVDNSPYDVDLGPLCRTLKWSRVEFDRGIDPLESERVLAAFDWTRTDAIFELDFYERPALYHMNVLIGLEQETGIDELRQLGLHVEELPLFPVERSGWASDQTIAWEDGQPVGRWLYVVAPAAVYNDVREASLQQIASGQAPEIRAMVFRAIPEADARIYSDPHQLRYEYLAEHGFEYNALTSVETGCAGDACQAILGWVFRKTVEFFVNAHDFVIDSVRQAFNAIDRQVSGSADIDLRLIPMNTDPAFGATRMVSAWRGENLHVADLDIEIRQGFGMKKTRTNEYGRITTNVATDVGSTICIVLANDYLELVSGWFATKTICLDGEHEWSGDADGTTVEVPAEHSYLNQLIQMTDTAEYVETVFGFDMAENGQTVVLVGTMSSVLAPAGRSYVPCMGSTWNPQVSSYGSTLVGLISPLGALSGPAAEALFSVDIVLHDSSRKSRGVGVHEYGHMVMCRMLRFEGGQELQSAWSDVVQASLRQDDDSEGRQIAEGFADYIASQVVGGTNYFPVAGSMFDGAHGMNYCQAGSSCLDSDYHEASTVSSDESAFEKQTRRYASLLHDLFDGATTDAGAIASELEANDGSHWDGVANGLWLASGSTLVPANRFNTSVDATVTAGTPPLAELVELEGTAMLSIFRKWSDRASRLKEESFLSAIGAVMRARDIDEQTICNLVQRHSASGTCPTYVADPISTTQLQQISLAIQDSATLDASGELTIAIADLDADGVPDSADNCPAVDNASQLDSNGNGVGNACDGDLTGDGVTGLPDMNALRAAFGTRYGEPGFDASADLDGDGAVGNADYAVFRQLLQVSLGGSAPAPPAPLPALVGIDSTPVAGDGLGSCAADLGDLDGNGVGDLAVGVPDSDLAGVDAGAVRILFLGPNGVVVDERDVTLDGVLAPYDHFGQCVASLGDLDGDGVPELAVGSPGYDYQGWMSGAGAVYTLFLEADGSLRQHQRIATMTSNGYAFGWALASVGDWNGDGIADLAVGAPGWGQVWVLLMNESGGFQSYWPVKSWTTLDMLGASITSLGDLDGDGRQDLAVGAPNVDEVRIFLTKWFGFAHTLTAPEPGTDFGASLASLGDLDGDGTLELAVGAPEARVDGATTGGVWLLSIDPSADFAVVDEVPVDASSLGLGEGDALGAGLAEVGDRDLDGTPELWIGAPGRDAQAGSSWLLRTDALLE